MRALPYSFVNIKRDAYQMRRSVLLLAPLWIIVSLTAAFQPFCNRCQSHLHFDNNHLTSRFFFKSNNPISKHDHFHFHKHQNKLASSFLHKSISSSFSLFATAVTRFTNSNVTDPTHSLFVNISSAMEPKNSTRVSSSPNPLSSKPKLDLKLLLIDNYDSYTYNLYQYLAEICQEKPIVIKNNDYDVYKKLMKNKKDGMTIDAIIISPGPGNPTNPTDVGVCKEVSLSQYICTIESKSLYYVKNMTLKPSKTISHFNAGNIRESNIANIWCLFRASIIRTFI